MSDFGDFLRGGFLNFGERPKPAHPIEEALDKVNVSIDRANQFVRAAWVASPTVAAVMLGEAETAMLDAARSYGEAKRIATGMFNSIEMTVAVARKGGR